MSSVVVQSVQQKSSRGRTCGKILLIEIAEAQCSDGEELVELVVDVLVPGDELVFVLVLLELDEPPDGSLSFTTVVLLSFFSPPGGVATVVSFCSQAVSNAAPANMQMNVFIMLGFDGQVRFLFTAKRRRPATSSSLSRLSYHCSTGCRSGWSWWCWFRIFARRPRGARRWPRCRCISS